MLLFKYAKAKNLNCACTENDNSSRNTIRMPTLEIPLDFNGTQTNLGALIADLK